MKRSLYKRTISLGFCLVLLVLIPLNNQAQTVKRQCISSYGAIVTPEGAMFKQTVGQPYNTHAYYENKVSILQGFQQPVAFKVETVKSKLTENLSLTVYPNPATYSVTIESAQNIENPKVLVTDVTGQLIFSEQATQLLKYNINCAAWKNGIYIVTVSDKNQNQTIIKLIINK